MNDVPTSLFIALGAFALLLALHALWQSFRLVLGAGSVDLAQRHQHSSERERLLNEKKMLLNALRDLENERDIGKLSETDFTVLSGQYRARARTVLEALDTQLTTYRAKAQELLGTAAAVAPITNTESVAVAAASMNACEQCATRNDTDAMFCKKCGHRLHAEVT